MYRANGWRSGGGSSFDRTLSQVIDGTGQSAGSLDEQFEPLILERIGMDPDGAEAVH